MDLVRTSLIGGAFLACLLAAAVFAPRVNAETNELPIQLDLPSWGCIIPNNEFPTTTYDGCDLSIKKEVSVNGGPFVDANTEPEAANATLNDGITYRISVSDTSTIIGAYYVNGAVQVADFFPDGVTYLTHSVSAGTYDQTTGTWQFNLSSSTSYPVTLTINAKATSTGQFKNNAFLSGNYCDGWCEYSDSDPENNSDDAWISVSGAPVVLGESSTGQVQGLADTGDSTVQSLVAGALIVVTLAVVLTGRLKTKTVKTDQ